MSKTNGMVVRFECDEDAEIFVDNLTMLMSQFHYTKDILEDADFRCTGDSDMLDPAIGHIITSCIAAQAFYPTQRTFFESVDIIDNKMVGFTIGAE